MSDERETSAPRAAETPESAGAPGSPVEENEASRTEVLAAVERSRDAGAGGADAGSGSGSGSALSDDTSEPGERSLASVDADAAAGRGSFDDSEPDAGVNSAASDADAAGSDGSDVRNGTVAAAAAAAAAEAERRKQLSEVDTQLDLQPATGRTGKLERRTPPTTLDDLPSAAAEAERPARDGEIRISSDHPMAALYTQTPMPPEIRGNRGAGVLIALLATIGFAAVAAGVFAAWLAPQYPPSTFFSEGLLPIITSVGFAAAVAAFFLALTIVVLVVGRAGWWAYVLGGFLVAAAVWGATVVGLALHDRFVLGLTTSLQSLAMIQKYGLSLPAIVSGLVAREVTVWFGAWIGSRGRRMKTRNAEALAEYEEALTESQAKQP